VRPCGSDVDNECCLQLGEKNLRTKALRKEGHPYGLGVKGEKTDQRGSRPLLNRLGEREEGGSMSHEGKPLTFIIRPVHINTVRGRGLRGSTPVGGAEKGYSPRQGNEFQRKWV